MTQVGLLLERVLAGDAEAWRAFQSLVEPTISAMARGHRDMRRKGLAVLADDVREVTLATLERLARHDFRNLRAFLERSAGDLHSDEALDDWLFGAVDYEIRDHLRRRFGSAPRGDTTHGVRALAKRDLHTLAERISDANSALEIVAAAGVTHKLTAAALFRHMESDFSPLELRAMQMHYLEDLSAEDIAAELGLSDPASATRLIRRLNARLRHHFVSAEQ